MNRRNFLRGLFASAAVAAVAPAIGDETPIAVLFRRGSIAEELAAVTRRAFVPRVQVQIYQASPLMRALLENADRSKPPFLEAAA